MWGGGSGWCGVVGGWGEWMDGDGREWMDGDGREWLDVGGVDGGNGRELGVGGSGWVGWQVYE